MSTNELMNTLFPDAIAALEPSIDSLREVAAVCEQHNELDVFLSTLDPLTREALTATKEESWQK